MLKLKLGKLRGTVKVFQGHITVLGRSGSGKTNTAKVLLEELTKKRISALVLDWAGEYSVKGLKRLIPGDNFSIPVFAPSDREDPERVDVIVDLFDATFHLTHRAPSHLRHPLNYPYPPRERANHPGALKTAQRAKLKERR
jgi:DNA helicase HerA-like ATPase